MHGRTFKPSRSGMSQAKYLIGALLESRNVSTIVSENCWKRGRMMDYVFHSKFKYLFSYLIVNLELAQAACLHRFFSFWEKR